MFAGGEHYSIIFEFDRRERVAYLPIIIIR